MFGARQLKPIAAGYQCKHCRVRYRQNALGLCRQCERALGKDVMTNQQRERAHLDQQRAKLKLLMAPDRSDQGPREIVVEGHVFDVVWDWTR